MIYLTADYRDFKPQIDYTFGVIFPVYGLPWRVVDYEEAGAIQPGEGDILISYGSTKPAHSFPKHIHIYNSWLFGEGYLKVKSLPASPLSRFGELPVIYHGKGEIRDFVVETATRNSRIIEANIDIFASSFFMLSRYEEVLLDRRDEHGRFPASESLAFREGFLSRPIVNEYIELLWSWIAELNPGLRRQTLWGGKKFAFCLTHDIDRVRKYGSPPVLALAGLLRRGRLSPALGLLRDYVLVSLRLKKDPFATFDYLLDSEQRHGFQASYYFMAGREWAYDPQYSPEEPGVQGLIGTIEEGGHEVGLHGGYGSFDTPRKMAAEKERLDSIARSQCYGCRQHGLRWRAPDTWRMQEKAGLSYDTSLAYADHVGFRAGICHPFHPFDVFESRELGIWELPLTIMEGTLHSYQKMPPEKAYNEIVEYVKTIQRYNGVFVLLWHNSSFDPLLGWEGWKEVYEDTLHYIKDLDPFISTGRGIIEWWARNAAVLPE